MPNSACYLSSVPFCCSLVDSQYQVYLLVLCFSTFFHNNLIVRKTQCLLEFTKTVYISFDFVVLRLSCWCSGWKCKPHFQVFDTGRKIWNFRIRCLLCRFCCCAVAVFVETDLRSKITLFRHFSVSYLHSSHILLLVVNSYVKAFLAYHWQSSTYISVSVRFPWRCNYTTVFPRRGNFRNRIYVC